MAFAEDFVALLSEHGIEVDPAFLPEQETIRPSLENVQTWFDELNDAVREGFDEGSEEFAVCHLLAEPELDVAPEIPSLLEAFDQIAGQRLSGLVSIAQDCLVQAAESNT